MTTTPKPFALDIFSISRPTKTPVLRKYRATWPCGSTWEFDRHDLDVPDFTDGDQNGSTFMFDTLREARATLEGYGVTVELVK